MESYKDMKTELRWIVKYFKDHNLIRYESNRRMIHEIEEKLDGEAQGGKDKNIALELFMTCRLLQMDKWVRDLYRNRSSSRRLAELADPTPPSPAVTPDRFLPPKRRLANQKLIERILRAEEALSMGSPPPAYTTQDRLLPSQRCLANTNNDQSSRNLLSGSDTGDATQPTSRSLAERLARAADIHRSQHDLWRRRMLKAKETHKKEAVEKAYQMVSHHRKMLTNWDNEKEVLFAACTSTCENCDETRRRIAAKLSESEFYRPNNPAKTHRSVYEHDHRLIHRQLADSPNATRIGYPGGPKRSTSGDEAPRAC